MSKTNVHSLMGEITPDTIAETIMVMDADFRNARVSWEQEMQEIKDYKYATSTNTTTAGDNGFNNSTTIPKMSHIATNLKANYEAHLFGDPNWIQFEAFDSDAASEEARSTLEAYARTKARRKDYESILGTCVDTWIDSGATFARQKYVSETYTASDGQQKPLYQGTVIEKISPNDISFDVTASSWKAARKIVRTMYTLGDIAQEVKTNPDSVFTKEHLDNLRAARQAVRNSGITAVPNSGIKWKDMSLTKAGFGTMLNYLKSDTVEVLEFFGSLYIPATGELLDNYKIVVVDRRLTIYQKPLTSPTGSQYLYYSGWEDRPDNLMGMSPLARLVGMQYKLDKLENMRADVFDRIVHPPIVEIGDVEFHGVRGAPGGRYVVADSGDVKQLKLDATILNADFQISQTMQIMEEIAGSPRNNSGFRTPGEKTKFEVQFLENGGNRIFRNKTNKFEREFIEPILNDMIELGRLNLGEVDLVSTEGTEFNTTKFLNISRSDLDVSGKLRARGSRLFAEKANALQNILGILTSGAKDMIAPHVSTVKLAQALESLAEIKEFGIITPYIAIQEQQQAQGLANQSSQKTGEADAVNALPPVESDDDVEEQ